MAVERVDYAAGVNRRETARLHALDGGKALCGAPISDVFGQYDPCAPHACQACAVVVAERLT